MDEAIEKILTNIIVIINDKSFTVKLGSTVSDLLRDLEIPPSHVAVQLDGVIIPRPDFAQAVLHEGSRLEFVTLVGGG